MKPKRPDSAKSRATQKTLDTQLNQSKFSQTFTSYTTFNLQKKDQFEKYLEEKQKDPKFKKYFQPSNLPQIPQKQQKQPKPQLTKINSKPFQKRNSKISGSKPKQQQTKQSINRNGTKTNLQSSSGAKWTVNQPNGNKKQNKQQFNSSTSFAEKNKQKMNSINAGLKKIENQEKKIEKKIDLKGFKVNVPGKKSNKTNQEQKQLQNQFFQPVNNNKQKQSLHKISEQTSSKDINNIKVQKNKPKEKTQQEIKRQQELLEISRFINQVEMKNIDYYPDGYEEFVQHNQSHVPQNLQKINIRDFLMQPTQRDYTKMQKRIRQNEKTLEHEEQMSQSRVTSNGERNEANGNRVSNNASTEQTSIDLDKMLDGDSQFNQENGQNNENQIFLSSISSKDLKQRNLFLTEVLKGRVTRQQITKLEQMDRSQIKMMKLQDLPKQDEDDIQLVEINMMKKKSNRLFQRNKIEAAGHIYRDCDYLSQQNKQRLERLLNGQLEPSPFQVTQWQRFAMRRLDQGIRLYRQFSSSFNKDKNQEVISEECLPKDPNLRKQAQRKILRDKIDSINSRLQQIQNIVINQSKIQALVQQHRTSRISQSTQSMIDERKKQIQEITQKSKLAAQMLIKAEQQKSSIQRTLKQMQEQYQKYEKQCKQYQKLSIEQIKQIEKDSIRQQKKILYEIQKDMQQLQKGTQQGIEAFHKQMQGQIEILREIQNLNNNIPLVLSSFSENQTIADIDEMLKNKADNDPDHVKYRIEQEKQNQQSF